MARISLIICFILTLYGCSGVDIRQYADNTPQFDLFDFFSGKTKGWGIVQGRDGTLKRQFVVDINGSLNDSGELVLDEDFFWADGEESKRVWTIGKISDNRYSGRAADVVGMATGESSGNVLNWQYQLNLDVDGSTWKISFDDWMFLQPDNILINRASMTKFGFRVGEVTIVFQKQ